MSNYRIKTFSSFDEALSIRPEWTRLAADHFMSQWNWLANWWDHCVVRAGDSNRCRPLIAAVLDEHSDVVGIAPFYKSRNLSGHALRVMGDGNACSDYTRILAEAGQERAVSESLADWISSSDFRRDFGAIDWLEIEGHMSEEITWQLLWNRLTTSGWSVDSRELEGTWLAMLHDNWEAFCKTISKSRKRKIKRAFAHLDEGRATCQFLTTSDECLYAWPKFVELHQKRRQTLGQSGCFANANFESFLRQVVSDYASVGQVVMTEVSHELQPFGYLLLFRTRHRLWMYQSGFDPEFDHLEPGHLVNTCSLRYAIEAGLTEFDFLRGDEPYKEAWGTSRIPLLTTRCTAPHVSARLKNTLWNAGRQLKSIGGLWSSPSTQQTPEVAE
jgi:CelD/BcsL family acetyltransferase involved in cellulose biosynthesis